MLYFHLFWVVDANSELTEEPSRMVTDMGLKYFVQRIQASIMFPDLPPVSSIFHRKCGNAGMPLLYSHIKYSTSKEVKLARYFRSPL